MEFEKALDAFRRQEVEPYEYAEAWLEELKFCYAKLGGRVNHFISFQNPCHWSFGVMDLTGGMFGTSRGNITVPAHTVHPENAARALIAYENLTVEIFADRAE